MAEENITKHSGSKYLRLVHGWCENVAEGAALQNTSCLVDVYAVLEAFDVHCPATQHALKKLLCAGSRFKNTTLQDLREARDSITRAIQMQERREQ